MDRLTSSVAKSIEKTPSAGSPAGPRIGSCYMPMRNDVENFEQCLACDLERAKRYIYVAISLRPKFLCSRAFRKNYLTLHRLDRFDYAGSNSRDAMHVREA